MIGATIKLMNQDSVIECKLKGHENEGTTREGKAQRVRKEGEIIREKISNKHIAFQEFIMKRNSFFGF